MSRDQRNNINIYLFMELDDENHNNIKANGTCMRWNQWRRWCWWRRKKKATQKRQFYFLLPIIDGACHCCCWRSSDRIIMIISNLIFNKFEPNGISNRIKNCKWSRREMSEPMTKFNCKRTKKREGESMEKSIQSSLGWHCDISI